MVDRRGQRGYDRGMETPVALIDPAPILKELQLYIDSAVSNRDAYRDYAQRYAYDALVKDHVNSGDEAREREVRAARSAFMHAGLSRGEDSTIHSLVTIQKLLYALIEDAKTRAAANSDSTS